MALSNLDNVLCVCPRWALHRGGLVAADVTSTLPITEASVSDGVQAEGVRWVLVRYRTTGDPTGVKLRPLFWDEVGEQWVEDPGVPEKDFAAATAGMFVFETFGRPFFIALTELAEGTDATATIEVSGFGY